MYILFGDGGSFCLRPHAGASNKFIIIAMFFEISFIYIYLFIPMIERECHTFSSYNSVAGGSSPP